MKDYILNRLRIDATRTIQLAENESRIQHPGLKGRLRELLISNLLNPWLPPYVSCGTGMIVAEEDIPRESTQDDIIIYDTSLVPPILASPNAPEGIFLFNSVITRIEVKSILTKDDIRKFVRASRDIARLKFTVQKELQRSLFGPLNMLFAYDSTAKRKNNANYQIERIIEVMEEEHLHTSNGIISLVCIPGYGLWKIAETSNKEIRWQRLNSTNESDHLTWFIGVISNTCYQEHAKRQGRDPKKGLEGGIGMYIPGGTDIWHWI